MKVCVFGAGAVGGFIAARLARSGCDVSVVARGAHLEAITAKGLTLLSNGERHTVKVNASDDPRALGPQDHVFLTVKAPALASAAPQIAPLLGADTTVVPGMNGVPWWFFERFAGPQGGTRVHAVDPDGAIARAIPIERVVGCVVYPAASVPEPGVVKHGSGNRIVVGEPSGALSERAQALEQLLSRAGFAAEATQDIRRELWLKLWGNVNFNPVSVLAWQPTDKLIDDPYVRELFVNVMNEAKRIADALGIRIDTTTEERIAVTRKLGNVKTSMLQDAEAGRALEIDAIIGAVVEIAARLGVATPFINALYGLVRLRGQALGLYTLRDSIPDRAPT